MSPEIVKLLLQGVEETIFMVAVSGIIATGIGIPIGHSFGYDRQGAYS